MEDELDTILAQYGNFDLQLELGSTFFKIDPVPGSSTSVQTQESSHPETTAQLTDLPAPPVLHRLPK